MATLDLVALCDEQQAFFKSMTDLARMAQSTNNTAVVNPAILDMIQTKYSLTISPLFSETTGSFRVSKVAVTPPDEQTDASPKRTRNSNNKSNKKWGRSSFRAKKITIYEPSANLDVRGAVERTLMSTIGQNKTGITTSKTAAALRDMFTSKEVMWTYDKSRRQFTATMPYSYIETLTELHGMRPVQTNSWGVSMSWYNSQFTYVGTKDGNRYIMNFRLGPLL